MSLSSKPPPPSLLQLVWNTTLCIVLGIAIGICGLRSITNWPVTAEAVFNCALSEWNRRKGIRRIKALEARSRQADVEKGDGVQVRYMGSVVGYREDPALFRRCLESYKPSTGLGLLLVGIDGNDREDLDMAAVVEQVYPTSTTYVAIEEPLGLMTLRLTEAHAFGSSWKPSESIEERLEDLHQLPEDVRTEASDFAMRQVLKKTRDILANHNVLEPSNQPGELQVICFHQPHVCKKDIMFTNLVASLVLRQTHGLEFIWTSDSDTLVLPDTTDKVIGAMTLDPLIGGSSVTLGIHNAQENWITRLGAAVYWSEMAITRSQNGAVDAVDCQPGPCAAFRFAAIEDIIFRWYTQTSLGIRTIVNEDRHLTTLLLLQNYKVTFLSTALALTDTPPTLVRWLLQQLRWARAAHIERFQYPRAYAIHGPVLFVNALVRHHSSLCVALCAARYAWDGRLGMSLTAADVLLRVALFGAYNAAVHPLRAASIGPAALVLAQLFYQLPLPGIVLWSTLTTLQGGWGTQMRAAGVAPAKGAVGARWRLRPEVVDNVGALTAVAAWLVVVGAAVARAVATKVAPAFVNASIGSAVVVVAVAMCWVFLKPIPAVKMAEASRA
ncbi:hypothetical protein EAF04_006864 [Neofusicoccum parvum]|nr:hypothetical protein EAF04_006864 [Neofusicoccum parvum]